MTSVAWNSGGRAMEDTRGDRIGANRIGQERGGRWSRSHPIKERERLELEIFYLKLKVGVKNDVCVESKVVCANKISLNMR